MPVANTLLRHFLLGYFLLAVTDKALTYAGIKYYGCIEVGLKYHILADSWGLSTWWLEYFGLQLGIAVQTLFCLSVGWLLWKIRRFILASFLGLAILTAVMIAAVINNIVVILH